MEKKGYKGFKGITIYPFRINILTTPNPTVAMLQAGKTKKFVLKQIELLMTSKEKSRH